MSKFSIVLFAIALKFKICHHEVLVSDRFCTKFVDRIITEKYDFVPLSVGRLIGTGMRAFNFSIRSSVLIPSRE